MFIPSVGQSSDAGVPRLLTLRTSISGGRQELEVVLVGNGRHPGYVLRAVWRCWHAWLGWPADLLKHPLHAGWRIHKQHSGRGGAHVAEAMSYAFRASTAARPELEREGVRFRDLQRAYAWSYVGARRTCDGGAGGRGNLQQASTAHAWPGFRELLLPGRVPI